MIYVRNNFAHKTTLRILLNNLSAGWSSVSSQVLENKFTKPGSVRTTEVTTCLTIKSTPRDKKTKRQAGKSM